MANDTQNWTVIRQRASENPHWPGLKAYFLCHICPKGWLRRLQLEARRHGCWVDFHRRGVYIVVPKPLTQFQKDILRFLAIREGAIIANSAYLRSLKILAAKGLVKMEPTEDGYNFRGWLAPFKSLPARQA
jgi:hypothetical protein